MNVNDFQKEFQNDEKSICRFGALYEAILSQITDDDFGINPPQFFNLLETADYSQNWQKSVTGNWRFAGHSQRNDTPALTPAFMCWMSGGRLQKIFLKY